MPREACAHREACQVRPWEFRLRHPALPDVVRPDATLRVAVPSDLGPGGERRGGAESLDAAVHSGAGLEPQELRLDASSVVALQGGFAAAAQVAREVADQKAAARLGAREWFQVSLALRRGAARADRFAEMSRLARLLPGVVAPEHLAALALLAAESPEEQVSRLLTVAPVLHLALLPPAGRQVARGRAPER